MTRIIDACLIVAIVLVGWFSISEYNRMETLPIKGGFLAIYTTEVLMYLAVVLVLILSNFNRKLTYVIAAPLFIIVIFVVPLGFFMG